MARPSSSGSGRIGRKSRAARAIRTRRGTAPVDGDLYGRVKLRAGKAARPRNAKGPAAVASPAQDLLVCFDLSSSIRPLVKRILD